MEYFYQGLLEAPAMPPQIQVDIVRYKVFLAGKSGVGKTALAARLAGSDIPNVHYETTGRCQRLSLALDRSPLLPIGLPKPVTIVVDSLSNGGSFLYGKYKDIFSRLHVA